MTGATMKPFKNATPDPSDPIITTTMNQKYHLDPPVTGDHLFTRDGNYFQLIKQDAEIEKHFVSTMTSCHVSSTNTIIMWYQSVTIHSATHRIYLHPYYCFRTESHYPKGFSYVNDPNKTKHDLPENSTMLYE